MRFPLHPPKNKGFHSRQLLLCKKSVPPKVVMSIKSGDQEDFRHISVLHFLVLLLLRHPSVCAVGLNFGPAFGRSWLGSFFISDPLFNGEGCSWQLFLQERIFLTRYSCSIKQGKTGSNKIRAAFYLALNKSQMLELSLAFVVQNVDIWFYWLIILLTFLFPPASSPVPGRPAAGRVVPGPSGGLWSARCYSPSPRRLPTCPTTSVTV